MSGKSKKSGYRKPKPVFAKKSFGQNFLVDRNYISKIISALNPKEGERIIEIGSGRGALTEELLASGAEVKAVELERDMIAVLREKFDGRENFQLIESDALKVDFRELARNSESENSNSKAKLVANLPYYISTAILQKLIEEREAFSEMVLMFQREVVERITARAGDSERGFLTVLTEAFLKTEKLFDVPPSAFRPAPKVWSAVVRLVPKNESFIEDEELFRTLASAAFKQKRKTIFNNLKASNIAADWTETLRAAQVEPGRRAESLSLDEWRRIISAVRST
jgi:dimethyladenosine transferase